jgi:hypothetical protein
LLHVVAFCTLVLFVDRSYSKEQSNWVSHRYIESKAIKGAKHQLSGMLLADRFKNIVNVVARVVVFSFDPSWSRAEKAAEARAKVSMSRSQVI